MGADLRQLSELFSNHLKASEVEDGQHAVIQSPICSSASSSGSSIEVSVDYNGVVSALPSFPSTFTGLQLKSLAIATAGAGGGFQDYFLTLNALPFGARSRVSDHSGVVEGATLLRLVLEDVGDRRKAVGMT
ncbi:hypothetical protein TeGR_g11110 [Tetraparma gracilis]|uniref:Uncharacterized protein n=1 Tax=Tetraparma gracilis TaxID=2962635 RepID=A0ABQ6N3A4_9STRA|nr:hypothetical protein TeGR_g11110 [Tetraparma gracilis]